MESVSVLETVFCFGNSFLFPNRIDSSASYHLVSKILVNLWGRTTACKLRFHLSYYKYLTVISTIPRPSAGYNESQNDHAEPWIAIHDRIKPYKVKNEPLLSSQRSTFR